MSARSLLLALAALLAAAPGPAKAQAPILVVVNFAAGGPTDITARMLQPELSQLLGAQVVIKNTIGAAGTIGTAEVARARPDGLTLLFSPVGPLAVQPNYLRNLAYAPTDFAPVCQVTEAALVMMTPRASGLRTLADVEARARAMGGNMPYASSGIATLPHISMVAWTRAAGVALNHIPFRGTGEAMLAFQQGIVGLMADQPGTARLHDLHAIATFAAERTPEFPETPTMRELGYDLSYTIWQGLLAPAGVPPAVLARLEDACARAVQRPAVQEGLRRIQTPLVYRNGRDFAAFIGTELAKYRALIEATGMRQAE